MALLACNDGTGVVSEPLYPSRVGTQWTYALYDTVVSGAPEISVPLPITVRHRADTMLSGQQWMLLDNGQAAFGGTLTTAVMRNGPDGLQVYVPPLGPLPAGEYTLLPNRLGASSRDWKLTALADTIQTPAGAFVALHFTSVTQPGDEVVNHMWVAPGTGIVRSLTGLGTESASGITIREFRFILELQSIVRP